MLVSFSYGGHSYQINVRHIACLTSTVAGKGPVNVSVQLVGSAQPLTLQLAPEQFADLARAFDAACRDGNGGSGCSDGKAAVGIAPDAPQ